MRHDNSNPLGNVESVFDPASSLTGDSFDQHLNIFGDPLSQSPQAMPISSDVLDLLGEDISADSVQSALSNRFETSDSSTSWTSLFPSGAPAIDAAIQGGAKLANVGSEFLEQNIEAGTSLAKDAVQAISESVQGQFNHVSSGWNNSDNRLHNTLNKVNNTVIDKASSLATAANQSQLMAKVKKGLTVAKGFVVSATEALADRVDYSPQLTPQEVSVLEHAASRLKKNLVDLRDSPGFINTFETAFGDQWEPSEAKVLVDQVVEGNNALRIEIVDAEDLQGAGAFGDGRIFIADNVLTKAIDNLEFLDRVLLEETGHYFDQELNLVDSLGDEGDIFARLAKNEFLSKEELQVLKAEDDHSEIFYNSKKIIVENIGWPGWIEDAGSAIVTGAKATYDFVTYPFRTHEDSDTTFVRAEGSLTNSPSVAEKNKVISTLNKLRVVEPKTNIPKKPEAATLSQAALNEKFSQTISMSTSTSGTGETISIESGDTLSAIAAQHGVEWTELINPETNKPFTDEEARTLQVGSEVILPGSSQLSYGSESNNSEVISDVGTPVSIESGDTLSAIAAQHGVEWTKLINPKTNKPFTDEEARTLQVGSEVILPGSSQLSYGSESNNSEVVSDVGTPISIESGDTLSAIAAQHGVEWTKLINPETNKPFTDQEARALQVGSEVILPSSLHSSGNAESNNSQVVSDVGAQVVEIGSDGIDKEGQLSEATSNSSSFGVSRKSASNSTDSSIIAIASRDNGIEGPDLMELEEFTLSKSEATTQAVDFARDEATDTWSWRKNIFPNSSPDSESNHHGERDEFLASIRESSSEDFEALVEDGSIAQEEGRQTRYFHTDFVPGDGLIAIEFVIQEDVSGGFLGGDGRDLTTDPLDDSLALDDSRMLILIDRETGRGAITVSASETAFPGPLGGLDFEVDAREIAFEERKRNEFSPKNYFTIDASKNKIEIDYDAINPITAMFQAISVDGPIVLERGANGDFKIGSTHSPDLYPAVSVTQYKPDGSRSSIYHEEGTNVFEGATPEKVSKAVSKGREILSSSTNFVREHGSYIRDGLRNRAVDIWNHIPGNNGVESRLGNATDQLPFNNAVVAVAQALVGNGKIILDQDATDSIKADSDFQRVNAEIIDVIKNLDNYGQSDMQIPLSELKNKDGEKLELGVELGGKRGNFQPWDVDGSAPTWRVAANELTWLLRHAQLDGNASVSKTGEILIDYVISDKLDLRPGEGRSGAYNNVTTITGFLWHNVLGAKEADVRGTFTTQETAVG